MTASPFKRRPRRLAECVSFHARRTPGRTAVVVGDQAVSYAELDRDVRRTLSLLADLGLERGSLVALNHEPIYGQILLLLGFECLDVVVGHFRLGEGAASERLLRQASLVVVSAGISLEGPGRILRLDAGWEAALSAAAGDPPHLPRSPAPASGVVLLMRTSGTTGLPKWMRLSREVLDIRIRQRARLSYLGCHSRVLRTLPLRVAGMYYAFAATLRLGATLVDPVAPPSRRDLADSRITHATFLPLQLDQVIRAASADATPLPGLTVCVIGARLGASLRERALSRLCWRVLSIYSSNEAGTVCQVDLDGTGAILPGIQVEIVDELSRPVPPETVGHVRVRSAAVAPGYADASLMATRPFQDGWLDSDDLGALTRTGRLRVLARSDDVVNLGGLKCCCEEIEDKLRHRLALRDVAVFTDEDPGCGPILVVCAVVEPPFDGIAALRKIAPEMGTASLWIVDAIPRTPEGKIRRRALRGALAAGTRGYAAR